MKKTIIILVVGVLTVFALTGCLKVSQSTESESVAVEQAQETDEKINIDDTQEVATGFGAQGAFASEEFSLEEMLRYAVQDEYLARQEYESIMEEYGEVRPFSNIIRAEETHIAILKELYETYDLDIPEDTAIDHAVVPDSLDIAFKIGVQAEIDNIAMYEKFLEQDLPDDVKEAFIELRDGSKNHLAAFERGPRGRGNG